MSFLQSSAQAIRLAKVVHVHLPDDHWQNKSKILFSMKSWRKCLLTINWQGLSLKRALLLMTCWVYYPVGPLPWKIFTFGQQFMESPGLHEGRGPVGWENTRFVHLRGKSPKLCLFQPLVTLGFWRLQPPQSEGPCWMRCRRVLSSRAEDGASQLSHCKFLPPDGKPHNGLESSKDTGSG